MWVGITYNTINSATKQYTYDGENRMLSENGVNYSYDSNGNLVSKSTGGLTSETFEYAALNRLAKYTSPDGSTTTYKYDPFGRRIEKSGALGTKKYLWDGIKIICEYDGADTLTDKLTYGINREILSRRATITVGTTTTTADYFYHHDHLGSVVMITDSTGAVVNTYNYDDFGGIISSTETLPNDYTYTGKQLDRETGLYYYGARYYDAKTGRFIGKDLLEGDEEEPQTLNRYVYVINDPLYWIDEWGLEAEKKKEEEKKKDKEKDKKKDKWKELLREWWELQFFKQGDRLEGCTIGMGGEPRK